MLPQPPTHHQIHTAMNTGLSVAAEHTGPAVSFWYKDPSVAIPVVCPHRQTHTNIHTSAAHTPLSVSLLLFKCLRENTFSYTCQSFKTLLMRDTSLQYKLIRQLLHFIMHTIYTCIHTHRKVVWHSLRPGWDLKFPYQIYAIFNFQMYSLINCWNYL